MTPEDFEALLLGLLLLDLVILVLAIWLSGRILGVRRGFWRSLVVGLLALVVGMELLGWELGSEAPGGLGGAIAVLFGTTLVLAMVFSLVLDALLPQRPAGSGGVLRTVPRRVRGAWASWGRVLEIARNGRSHGLPGTSLSSPEGARALRETLEDCGGILVKFGQIASTRADLLPPTVTEELASLRSSVPGLPLAVVTRRIESELGAPVGQLFATFDPEPLAAASIAVTHRATLADGRRVIVKVQRPGIEDTVERDARVLRWGARKLEARRESFARLQVTALAEELIDSVRRELDFTAEQASNAAMRTTRSADPGMRFPEILPRLTTRRVLVMEEVDGHVASDAAALAAAARPRAQIADNLLGSFLAQALVDGMFHADPHPGNVLVDAAGDVWLIDYGAVGVVDPITLEGLQQLAGGFLQRDASVMARAVRRMVGTQGTRLDIVAIETDMAAVLGQFGGGAGFDPAILAAVARSLARYDVAAPAALTVLARAALTLDGTLDIIDPGFAMGQRAQPHIKTLAAEQLPSDPRELAMHEAVRSLPSLRMMPQLAEDLALQARAGRLTLRSERYAGRDRPVVDAWVDRILFVSVGLGGGLISVLLIGGGVLASGQTVERYLFGLGFVGLTLTSAMLLRAVAQIQGRQRERGQ
jgi:ubiquinone biosynthesis protein